MEPRTVEQVESWSTRSVADGYAGLRELSDGEFSGAVRGSGAWLFMLNGRIVGVFEGTLDDFENADGTAYAAPHPSLPLLFSMQEQGGDTRARYYTNDTPLSEVDRTLSEGKFTGFVELSENVLSGDYYVAYYGGRSLSVAFVGASEQVVTGDEAFERADDEVGIYEVTDVDVTVTDVPEPDDDADGASGDTTAGGVSGGATSSGASGDTTTSEAAASATTRDAAGDPAGGAGSASDSESRGDVGEASGSPSEADSSATGPPDGSGSARSESGSPPSANRPSGDDSSATGRSPSTATGEAATSAGSSRPEPTTSTDDASATTDSTATVRDDSTSDRSDPTADRSGPASRGATSTRGADATQNASGSTTAERSRRPTDDAGSTANDGPAETEASATGSEPERSEATTIPSLDPDLSENIDPSPSDVQASTTAARENQSPANGPGDSAQSGRRASGERSSRSGATGASGSGATGASGSGATGASASESSASKGESGGDASESSDARARIQTLRKQLRQRKQQVEQLKERLSTLESERNEYKRERDALSQEVERLEAKLEGSSSTDGSAVGRRLSESDAFAGTNLFVRYDSKGEATLDEAANGQVDQSDVNANLRLEHHTQFEASEASVDGEPFEAFLTDSFEYQFATWVVEELLYEIRDTGKRNGLKELYEAIPKIDRVDLHGTVSAGDDREDTRQESFDVIMRDRMGEPLVVAALNDSRDPTTGEMMGSLVDAGSGVSQAHDELAGAFQVTASFFEPEALETAEAATSGGLLSRQKRASFVKLSRKRGYHLCLVESRDGDFHLSVPEL